MICEAPECTRVGDRCVIVDGRSCRLCGLHRGRWERGRSFDLPARPPRFPASPLLERVSRAGGPYRLCGRGTRLWCMLRKAQSRGSVNIAQADELAIGLLGEHPSAVWDDWWEESA